MGNLALTYQTTLHITECPSCHVLHGFPAEMYERLGDGRLRNIYCPNGHSWIMCETKLQKLEKELSATKNRLETAQRTANQESIRADQARKKLKRFEKRVHKGACPHCNRWFLNLARHMDSKHGEGAPQCT